MTDEEKKAIEQFRENASYCITGMKTTSIIINLIEKQQKETEKKDKIIDEMAKELKECFINCEPCNLEHKVDCKNYENCKECIKQYFEKKVEGKQC